MFSFNYYLQISTKQNTFRMTCLFAKKWPSRVPTYLSTNVQLNYGYCFSVVCSIMWPECSWKSE